MWPCRFGVMWVCSYTDMQLCGGAGVRIGEYASMLVCGWEIGGSKVCGFVAGSY